MGILLTEWIVFHHHFLFLIAGLLLLGCAFILAKRLIDWALQKRRGYFLSFVVGSLLFLNIFFIILIIGNEEAQAIYFFPYLLQVISIYGFVLAVFLGLKSLYQWVLYKKA
jgi:hypothetical protein